MTDQHPITPPPELVREWLGTYFGTTIAGEVSEVELALATQAAHWGSDQELEACCEWVKGHWLDADLRTARRPKPPSLKAQALEALKVLERDYVIGVTTDTIRKALEQLDD